MDFFIMLLLLVVCSVKDILHYKVPNYLILSGWLTDIVFRLYWEGLSGAGMGLACIAASILLFFPIYLCRAVGAGDVKLLSVISGMYGLAYLLGTSIFFGIFAAIAALIRLLAGHSFFKRFRYLFDYLLGRKGTVYYDSERDGRDMVLPLAPILLAAFLAQYFFPIAISSRVR